MLRMGRAKIRSQQAQNLVEYTIVIGVVIIVLYAMTPMFKRAIQGMVKVVADQVGNQPEGDQLFEESGHLEGSYTVTNADTHLRTREYAGTITYFYDGSSVQTVGNAKMNLGLTPAPPQ